VSRSSRGNPSRRLKKRPWGRKKVWWYKIGWRGVLVDWRAYLWRTSRWLPIIDSTTVDLVGVHQRQWMTVIGDHLMSLKKDASRKVEGTAAALIDEKASKKWPVLLDHLTQVAWEDGTPRQTSTLSVFVGDGAFKALLKDRETALCLWVACPVLDKLFDVIEAALVDPGTVWRRDRQTGDQKASRVKK